MVSIEMHPSTLNMWFSSHSNIAHLVLSVGKCVLLLTQKVRILPKITITLVKCFTRTSTFSIKKRITVAYEKL